MKLFKRLRSKRERADTEELEEFLTAMEAMSMPALAFPVTPVEDPEDRDGVWMETPDGLRLIFRGGKYVGWCATTITEPMG